MIHTTSHGNQKRRIAIVQVPRMNQARLGSIANAPAARAGWTTVSDEAPDSSASWLSLTLRQQARARETTPGTLSYTPASNTPAQNVAPWNSWQNPNCGPFNSQTPAPAPAEAARPSMLWLAVGLLGAAASVKYLMRNERGF